MPLGDLMTVTETANYTDLVQKTPLTARHMAPHFRVWNCGKAALIAATALLVSTNVYAFETFRCERVNDQAMKIGSYGKSSERPAVKIHRVNGEGPIVLDGRLDDAAWTNAAPASGFTMWDPNRGEDPSEETVFKVAYDEDAIYFGVACHERDPKNITKTLSRRDSNAGSDIVSIYIDPYYDRTTGYNFRVNPLGVQEDAYMYNDGSRDSDWDAVWQAETYEDESGWYAELRIPFSSIRYRESSDRWGLQVYRYMHGRGEDTAWVTWDRDTSGFTSHFGELHGIENVPAPRQLEIYPYAVARTTDPSMTGDEEHDDFQNFGVDLKYGITSDLSLNATFQPDFGQVEADPAVLNLSPFETFFSEKRPFFIEGARFFDMPDFTLFYSRRIGTGGATSRIRAAAKLTGKTAGDVSVAGLYATTDVTEPGQTHNFLKSGERRSHYAVTRVGKEWLDGRVSVNAMQTAVVNEADREEYGDRASREGYSTGLDVRYRTADRKYTFSGAFVGTIVDPEEFMDGDTRVTPGKKYGTGGDFGFQRGGTWSGGAWTRWESDELDPNDAGFLGSPDEMNTGGWFGYNYNPDGKSDTWNRGNVYFNIYKSWLYAGRTGYDLHDPSKQIWSYGRGHRNFSNGNVNGWMQFTNYWSFNWGVEFIPEGTQRFETRSTVTLADGDRANIPGGGPLMDEPTTYGAWWGVNSDSRKSFSAGYSGSYYADVADNYSLGNSVGVNWTQSSSINHELDLGFRYRLDDTQHLDNFENQTGGIGGVSYVFGKIQQRTLDVTLRTNVLFNRNLSLELYAQPFITTGDYTDPRQLVRPDSYDLSHYSAEGFRVTDYDFSFASMNLNLVGRWEYRPGSTIYLVWTQSRNQYQERSFGNADFDNDLGTDPIFGREPENTFLVKMTYWLPI